MGTLPNFSIIEVAVNRHMFQNFDYILEYEYISNDLIGTRVQVSFANSKEIGVIVKIKTNSDIAVTKLKKAKLLDTKALITTDVMHTINFGSAYYHYPLGQCLQVCLPKLLRTGSEAKISQIMALELVDPNFDSSLLKKDNQKALVETLKQGAVKVNELKDRGFSTYCKNALIKKGIVRLFDIKDTFNYSFDKNNIIKNKGPILNTEQQAAVNIINSQSGFNVFVLNGVTGSGKTEVYLNIIAHTLASNKRVLVLVPEISLAPQTFNRFYQRFKVPIVSMHSGLSDKERCDAFLEMYYDKAYILIGTRSALFTPIKNLGLIVIDEEHDGSFKQSDGFRYHARNLAIVRAKYNNAKIVLGSATPSLETINNYLTNKYSVIYLKHRAANATLPKVELVDLKTQILTDGLKTGIGNQLEDLIGQITAKGDQVVLFLNRRGYSKNIVCHNCGYIFTCKHCDSPLTVHKTQHKLICHICDYQQYIPTSCPKCHNKDLLENGFGTEQIEEFLKLRYPDLGIVRIDRDNIQNKNELEKALELVHNKKAHILIGTQMLAKGHDFADVTLVGIIDIDSNLYTDDYRGLETSLQLITQVAGRAGRSHKQGLVTIQSHETTHWLLNDFVNYNKNYETIAMQLLEQRREQCLPPFANIAYILANSTVRDYAFELLEQIEHFIIINYQSDDLFISPICSDKIEKRFNRLHLHIFIKTTNKTLFHEILSKVCIFVSSQLKLKGDCRFALEVDPYNIY